MIALKFLRPGRVGPFSRVAWPAPADGEPGGWVARAGRHRVHACRAGDLPEWIDRELWRVELGGDVRVECGMLAAERGRLLERVDGWDEQAATEFAAACTLRARDAAVAVLGAGPDGEALQALATAAAILDATAALGARADLDDDAARAVAYAGDTARHAVAALADPATAPGHAAASTFIASHAAALAAGDVAAVVRERAWQADWMARRLGLDAS